VKENSGAERREYERYVTDLKLDFQVAFSIKTKIDFRIKDKKKDDFSTKKYSAVSKNISAEGLCFSSPKQLNTGDMLLIEVYVPSAKIPISMKGEVKWSSFVSGKRNKEAVYDTGILLLSVQGKSVRESIFVDETNHVTWSNVLESVFSSFKNIALERKKYKPNPKKGE
jgi:hypothetical protein